MPRIRSLKPEHGGNRKVGKLSDRAYRLWINLIAQADDEGRRLWDADEFRVLVWPYHRAVRISQVLQAMQEILDRGLCILYSNNGRTYYELHDWAEHQYIQHASPSSTPSPGAEGSRILMRTQEDSIGLTTPHPDLDGSDVLLSPTTELLVDKQDIQTKKVLRASDVPEAANQAAEKSARIGREAKAVLDFWFTTYKQLFGQAPEVEGARDMLAAKALLGGRSLEQAQAVVTFHFAHPSPFYAERKLFGLHHIRKDCNQIIARMSNLGPAMTGPDYLPKSTKRTLAAVDTFRRGGKPDGRK